MAKKSYFLKWIAVALVLALALGGGLLYLVRSYVSKDYLVELSEESLNCRVEIGDVDFNLFGGSGIKIQNIRIAERDSLVEEAVPHDQRPKLKDSDILIASLGLKLSFADILSKKIDVSQVLIDGAEIKMVMEGDGSLNLSQRFRSPEDKAEAESSKNKESKEDKPKNSKKSFNAKDQSEFVTLLKEAEIRDSSVSLVIEKSGLHVRITELNMLTKDIKIDPNSLETVNQATIQMSGLLSMQAAEGHEFGRINFEGPTSVHLFNPTTGEMEPNAAVNFKFSEGSFLNPTVPAIKKVWSKLDVLKKVGVKVGNLPDRLTFGREQRLAASYHMGLAELDADISLRVENWELAVLKGGWANIPQSIHGAHAELVAPQKHSIKVNHWVESAFSKIPGEAGEKASTDFKSNWFNETQQLTVQVSSKGNLSKPSVSLVGELPELKDILKTAGKDRLQSELNKLIEEEGESKLKKEAGNLLRGLLSR